MVVMNIYQPCDLYDLCMQTVIIYIKEEHIWCGILPKRPKVYKKKGKAARRIQQQQQQQQQQQLIQQPKYSLDHLPFFVIKLIFLLLLLLFLHY